MYSASADGVVKVRDDVICLCEYFEGNGILFLTMYIFFVVVWIKLAMAPEFRAIADMARS